MSAPLVSCVIPAFNAGRFLAASISSVLAQSYRPLEIVVCDDGSTDDTAAVIARFGGEVVSVRQDHAGVGPARDAGVRHARGDLVAFHDADDLWLPGKLTTQVEVLERVPRCDLVLTWIENFWEAELAGEERELARTELARPHPGHCIQTVLARRTLVDRVGPFAAVPGHGADKAWLARARTHAGRTEIVPRVLVRRRIHSANMSRGGDKVADYLDLAHLLIERRRRRAP